MKGRNDRNLVETVSHHVVLLLRNELSPDLHFHNLRHTLSVVDAASEIGKAEGLSVYEQNIVTVAAWFHDCGYVRAYLGHEDESKWIARDFLVRTECDASFIEDVVNCIEATRFPQRPYSRLSEVLCDADLYHFSKAGYWFDLQALRREFATFLGQNDTDEQWCRRNCTLLKEHRYFTSYEQNVLQKFKETNMLWLDCDQYTTNR